MSAPGYQLPRDPTAVMGARIGAWIVDTLLLGLVLLFLFPGPLNGFAKYYEVDSGGGLDGWEACEVLEDSDEADVCFPWGDRVYVTEGAATALPVVAGLLYWLLILGVLQGVTGWTPGKLLFGLRTVAENGQRPGIGRALLRSLLWVIDAQPCGVPLVGFISGLTSTGHRRVGDMAAKTYVVRAGDAGQPVVVPGFAPGQPAGNASYPGYGQPPAYPAPGGYGGAPAPSPWGSGPPTAPPGAPSPWGAEPGMPSGPPTAPPSDPRPAPPVTGETPVAAAPPSTGETPIVAAPPSMPSAAPATTTPGAAEQAASASASAPADETSPTQPSPAAEAASQPDVAVAPVPIPDDEPVRPTTGSTPAVDAPAAAEPTSGETPPIEADVVAVPETTTSPATETPEPEKTEADATDTDAVVDETPAASGTPAADAPPIAVGPATPPPAATRPEYNPQWDAARGTYIQWDANRSRWLQWDDAAKEWKPL